MRKTGNNHNMDNVQAASIVKNTFENPFDKNRFVVFINDLLNSYDHNKAFPKPLSGQYIKESYRSFISKFDRIGRYTSDENEVIDILIVYLQKDTSIERARTSQRNFIAGYLKGAFGSTSSKNAALVAFVPPDQEDWRFSLVKMDYTLINNKPKEEFSPAKRWSFLVGKNEASHTAKNSLVPIIIENKRNPALEEIEKAFNIEKVTKEFFEKYRELFLRTKEALDEIVRQDAAIRNDFDKKGVNTVDFVKKLLGQVVFLYFLQKKGWFGVRKDAKWGTGSKQFLRELFDKRRIPFNNFFNDILEPLFYEALACKRDEDYYERFACRIPFLNGGLFDPLNNYEWENIDILLSDSLFSNSYKTKEEDTGNGILDIFDRYNFTVKEDEPLEKEVAIDPEMLGKVFENLLEIKDRKSKGTYYTPREIVHYMCRESLKNYLHNVSGKAEPLFGHNNEETNYTFEELSLIRAALLSVRVCDPACGSGAFLLGIMSEMLLLIFEIDRRFKHRSIEEIKGDRDKEYTIIVNKNDHLVYNPDDELYIDCTYLGGCRFSITINNEFKGHLLSNDLALYLKAYINKFNRERGKKTIANIFSQGRIGDGKTFNTLRSGKNIKYITDKDKNIIWAYKNYDTEGATRKWRKDEKEQDDSRDDNAFLSEDNYNLYLYHLKNDIIRNCLYGVDIDPGAVEIAKLRLWLSLAVEYEGDEIEPLPNLDYKIMQGNSLLEEYEGVKLIDERFISARPRSAVNHTEITAINKKLKELDAEKLDLPAKSGMNSTRAAREKEIDKEFRELEKKLKKLKDRGMNVGTSADLFATEAQEKSERLKVLHSKFFDVSDRAKKEAIRKQIEKLETDLIISTLKEQGKQKALEKLEKYEKSNTRPYFLWKFNFNEVFRENGGFDVMIANPPYVQLQGDHGVLADLYQDCGYEVFARTGDIYCLFYERGCQLLREGGHLAYITMNKWMRAKYGEKLRKYFIANSTICELIDFGDSKIFENATTYTNIMILANGGRGTRNVYDLSRVFTLDASFEKILKENAGSEAHFTADSFIIGDAKSEQLRIKIEKAGTPLKDWDININYGIKTGFNEAFIIDTETKERLCAEDPKSSEILKPILRGRDIKRYRTNYAGLWLIFIPWHFPLHRDTTIQGASKKAEKEFSNTYPIIYKHLLKYKSQLEKRNIAETGIRYEWYALQRCAATYFQEFEKEKIVWGNLSTEPNFAFGGKGTLINAPGCMIVSDSKYLLCLLNSRLVHYLVLKSGAERSGGFIEYKPMYIERLPLPKIPEASQRPFDELVDRILSLTHSEDYPENETKQAKVKTLEREIDQMVYKLYGLDEEEIEIVEAG